MRRLRERQRRRHAAHILREIESAKKELLVAVYAFTSDDLASALVQAKKRGVGVQVVIDREFDLANEKSKGKFLDAQKIPLRRISGSVWRGTPKSGTGWKQRCRSWRS